MTGLVLTFPGRASSLPPVPAKTAGMRICSRHGEAPEGAQDIQSTRLSLCSGAREAFGPAVCLAAVCKPARPGTRFAAVDRTPQARETVMVIEPGRTYRLAPDSEGNHYIVSELVEYELRMLVEAMRTAAHLCDGFAEDRSEVEAHQLGALFHVFAERTASLAAECVLRTPARRAA